MPKGNETVTVVRQAKVDKLSSAPAGVAPEFDLEGCQVLPRQSFEEGRGWVNVDGWDVWCFTEPTQEVLYTDQLRVRGDLYQIEGKPARYDKRGRFKALKIQTQAVS